MSLMAGFSRNLGTLLESKVSLIDALKTTRSTLGNQEMENGLEQALKAVSQGGELAGSLKAIGLVPGLLVRLVRVGERTGDVGPMLLHAAAFYEDEVDRRVEVLTSVLEPLIILVLGAVIGVLLLSLYMPMFEIINSVQ
jgi:type IV pilus assembly protein PilC